MITKAEQAKPQRNMSLDLLRCIAMLMIVSIHCLGHGGVLEATEPWSFNYFAGWIWHIFTLVAVNCYVLITGYFQCKSKFKLEKALSLYSTVWFWSVVIYVGLIIAGALDFNLSSAVKSFLPFTQNAYWFFTTYLLLYILSPFLNHIINSINQKQHLTFLIVYFAVFIVLQNITFWSSFTGVDGNHFVHFVFLYFAAAYLRLYPPQKRHHWGLIYIVFVLLAALLRFAAVFFTTPVFGEPMGETAFIQYNSVTIVVASIGLFMFFASKTITNNTVSKIISIISPLTFGVYLIHDNDHIRGFIWENTIKPFQYANKYCLFPLLAIIIIGVFTTCCMLEKIRQLIYKLIKIDKVILSVSEFAKAFAQKSLMRFPIFK